MGPRIGLTCAYQVEQNQFYLNQAYTRSVLAAGGVPFVLPAFSHFLGNFTEAYFENLDGLIFTGGGDIDPKYLAEPAHPALGTVDPMRDAFELHLLTQALKRQMPILGICRGVQMLNVAAGGSIYQDLPSQCPGILRHAQKAAPQETSHLVYVETKSRLAQALGFPPTGDIFAEKKPTQSYLAVNSLHHQGIKQVAPGFRLCARSADEIVEAIESEEDSWVLGVQWHPEHLWEQEPRFLGLFKELVCAAARFAQQ